MVPGKFPAGGDTSLYSGLAGTRKSRWITAAVIFGAWTIYAVAMTVQAHYIQQVMGRPVTWGHVIRVEAVDCYLWALLTPVILWAARRFPLDQHRWYRTAPVHLAVCCGISILQRLVYIWISPPETPQWRVHDVWSFVRLVLATLDYTVLLYGVILLIYYAVKYYKRYQEGRLRASQLEAQLMHAELEALRMQLNPHFLFNTLHSISTLVRDDPDAAEEMIARLSELLRVALETGGAQLVPLHQEVEFAERYLEIEQIRFQERLTVRFDIDPETLDAEVPNLILQPLVENAIRHGIAQSSEGKVEVRARLRDAKLLLQVIDNGCGLAPELAASPAGSGVGLANTRARLATIYGKEHDFLLRNASNGGVEAAILIPFRTQGQGVHDRNRED